jgi:hypothetical protein
LRKLLVIVFLASCAALTSAVAGKSAAWTGVSPQRSFPDPPNDLTRVYYLSAENKLVPLPFEPGITFPNVFLPAQRDRVVQIDLKGPTAATILTNNELTFYVFVVDKMDPAPHQLVRLTTKKAARHLTISVVKGRKGYAPFAADNVGLEYRLLERLRVEIATNKPIFLNYMTARPTKRLAPGEYAIIGDSLSDMATFSIR